VANLNSLDDNVKAAIAVFDKSDHSSMRSIENCVIHFQNVAREDPLAMFVGNKIDLPDQEPGETAKLAQWAAMKGFLYTETSAATRRQTFPMRRRLDSAAVSGNQDANRNQRRAGLDRKCQDIGGLLCE
jgi:50S ribosomal subunit-associated GTPase HflX